MDLISSGGMTGFTNAGGFSDVNFPISFNKVFSICAVDSGEGVVAWAVLTNSISGTGATFAAIKHDGSALSFLKGYYIAIGQS